MKTWRVWPFFHRAYEIVKLCEVCSRIWPIFLLEKRYVNFSPGSYVGWQPKLSSAISIIQLIQYLALEISSAFSRVSLSSLPSGGVYTCFLRFEGKGKYTWSTRTLYITLVRFEVSAHGTSKMPRTRFLKTTYKGIPSGLGPEMEVFSVPFEINYSETA